MKSPIRILVGLLVFLVISLAVIILSKNDISQNAKIASKPSPLSLGYMRSQNYPGSAITVEQTLPNGSNYKRYIVSYDSDGLKEYAYLAVPTSPKPKGGYPVIVFNHGYQIPELYTPDGNYIAYMDALAKQGYMVFKPDYRGNGKSQGAPTSAYFSPDYDIDDLNAIASIKMFPGADPNKIGIWGHSMGGNITLRVAEVSKDIKAVVIWGGVVGDYNDIIYNWQDKVSYKPAAEDLYLRNLGLSKILAMEGTPSQNPSFWNSIDPFYNVNYLSAPVQIHVGLSDQEVPWQFSQKLFNNLKSQGKHAEFYEYPGANHDIEQGFNLAMQRTISFFNKYLK